MEALIVEDEVLALRHLHHVLDEIGGIRVIVELESINDTVEWFRKHDQPDVMFLDIHLADGIAFEIFRHAEIKCPVIFTTAYDEYALQAFKVNSIDYLLKPVQMQDVKHALDKLASFSAKQDIMNSIGRLIDSYMSRPRYKSTFLVPTKGDKLIPVQAEEIAYFYIDNGIVNAFISDGRKFIFDYSLDELTDMLDPNAFFRANRQYIVSRKAIRDIDIWFGSRLSVNLKTSTKEKVLVSKARISDFRAWYENS
ncbi:MAG TPA: LytTR family DNA-binding domain-containing protein [Bacteroidales bacterium]|nr:LytTR family DNA-binding domain-containing protein [Bacteroidales bacterium]